MHVIQSARTDMQPDNGVTQKCLNMLHCNAYENAMNLYTVQPSRKRKQYESA